MELRFYNAELCPEDVDEMGDSLDPNLTSPEQTVQTLIRLLLRSSLI